MDVRIVPVAPMNKMRVRDDMTVYWKMMSESRRISEIAVVMVGRYLP